MAACSSIEFPTQEIWATHSMHSVIYNLFFVLSWLYCMFLWGFIGVCLWRIEQENNKDYTLTWSFFSPCLYFKVNSLLYSVNKQTNNSNDLKFLLFMPRKAHFLLLLYVHQCQLGTKMCSSSHRTSADQWPLPCIFPLTIEKWRESWMASHQWWSVQPWNAINHLCS